MIHRFILNGDPVPWSRPGQSKYGRYDTQRAYKDAVGLIFKSQLKNHKAIEGFVLLKAIFYVPIPNSYSIKKRKQLDGTPCKKKPDNDNLIKLYQDILTEVGVWRDDAQVCVSVVLKIYSTNPMTVISVKEINNEEFEECFDLFFCLSRSNNEIAD